jgi:hypothetical protein
MTPLDARVATVTAPRPGGAHVNLGTRYVFARNALNVRTPPGARVLVAQDPVSRTWLIVGRER